MKSKLIIYIRFGLSWLGLLIIISACINGVPTNISDPDLIDQSWLEDKPCKPPCWYGISPGYSSINELLDAIPSIIFLDSEKFTEKDITYWSDTKEELVSGKAVWVYYKEPMNMWAAYFQFSDQDILNYIRLSPNYHITINEVVEKIGKPDGFTLSKKGPEGRGCDLAVIWLSRKMVIYYFGDNPSIFTKDLCEKVDEYRDKLPSGLDVSYIDLMDESQIEDFHSMTTYRRWQGFNTVK